MTPPLASINWLERVSKFRGTLDFLDYHYVSKGYNPRAASGRDAYEGKACRFHALSRPTTLSKSPRAHQPGSSSNLILLGFYEGFII